ncbi:carbohydrate kinase domain-containing protein [Ditylenchus destructor]|nr:carbohydrate kinase domain-containing protein [Ditylenchus destructor]
MGRPSLLLFPFPFLKRKQNKRIGQRQRRQPNSHRENRKWKERRLRSESGGAVSVVLWRTKARWDCGRPATECAFTILSIPERALERRKIRQAEKMRNARLPRHDDHFASVIARNMSTTGHQTMDLSAEIANDLKNVVKLFPRLTNDLKKGDCGKVGVIGGSAQYTGAPYFAASTAIKIGADLSYLFCHPEASPVIKSYSPELMVNPTLDFSQIEANLARLDVIVFGPGIGRDKDALVPLFKKLWQYVKQNPKICMVVDADGIFLLADCLKEAQGCKNAIITPNHREFDRLYDAIWPHEESNGLSDIDRVKKLSSHLGVCFLRKSDSDIITNGQRVELGKTVGTMRRCGGQGDVLSGATAIFAYWAMFKEGAKEYSTDHIINGAAAASDFVRFTSRQTFAKVGRAMNAGDIIAEIPHVVKQIDKTI